MTAAPKTGSRMPGKARVNVGLVGVGRMGLAYARYLATSVTGATLHAVSDVRAGAAEATITISWPTETWTPWL
jgi:predicted homoserine dehydrogenase-like protein